MRNKQKSVMNRFAKFAYILAGITTIMMIINVILSAELSQDGLAIDALSKRQIELKNSIRDTEQQILAETSLNDLSQKAELLNYAVPTSIVTVNINSPLAYQQR